MAERITIQKDKKPIYDIVIQDQFAPLAEEMDCLGYKGRKICIVTDSNTVYYANEIEMLLTPLASMVAVFTFPAGEENKNLDVVRQLYTFLIERKFERKDVLVALGGGVVGDLTGFAAATYLRGIDFVQVPTTLLSQADRRKFERKDVLVALGGGVVGDLTGFAAATYLRGIDFVQVPTTLLSQADSSIGGKTGVDFDGYKNMVGAFCMPKLVYMNVQTLRTLDRRIYLSGMGEVIKHGLIQNKGFYDWLKKNGEAVKSRSTDALIHMALENCHCKGSIVEEDPTEQGVRAILNFGHTLGHAIEKQVNFSMYHGECVAVGMVAAAYISYEKGFLKKEELKDIEDTLCMYELPIRVEHIDKYAVLKATKSDKKMENSKIRFILLSSLGTAFINTTMLTSKQNPVEVSDEDMIRALEYIGCI